jgi:hypothetical protein
MAASVSEMSVTWPSAMMIRMWYWCGPRTFSRQSARVPAPRQTRTYLAVVLLDNLDGLSDERGKVGRPCGAAPPIAA